MRPPPSNRGVRIDLHPSPGLSEPLPSEPSGASFDWYAATVHGYSAGAVLEPLLEAFPESRTERGRGRHGYAERFTLLDGKERICDVLSGSTPGVHVVSSGEASEAVSGILRASFPEHGVTRADGAVDWIEPGGFDRVAAVLIALAEDRGLKLNQQGDWTRGKARTLYVGSRASPAFLRLYEKGWQVGGDPSWIRLEVEVKPQRHARQRVAMMEPLQLFYTSPWVAEVAERLGLATMELQHVGTLHKLSDDDRALAFLVRQYGPLLERVRRRFATDAAFHARLQRYLDIRPKLEGTPPDSYLHRFAIELARVESSTD